MTTELAATGSDVNTTARLDRSADHLPRVPLLPPSVLRRHHCLEPSDTRFAAAARVLQSTWREERGLPMGSYTDRNGRRHKCGSLLRADAGRAGANFLSVDVANLVRRELAYREIGALIDVTRLNHNLLSSMPLTFNLLAGWKLDRTLANRVLRALDPGFDGEVTNVLFEHSPARGHPELTADHTAFDATIIYRTPAGRTGIICFEIKYSEAMAEPVPEVRPRLDELSRQSGLFLDPDARALRAQPCQQLWREHLLAQVMLDRGLAHEGTFVLVYPRMNWHAQRAAEAYARHLVEPESEHVRFVPFTLEHMIAAIAAAGAEQYAHELHRRYTDFGLVDRQLGLNRDGA